MSQTVKEPKHRVKSKYFFLFNKYHNIHNISEREVCISPPHNML